MSKRPATGGTAQSRMSGLTAYLRDRPIWVKLGLIVLIPTIATVAVGFSALLSNISATSNANRARNLAELGTNAQHAHQIGGNGGAVNPIRLAIAGKVKVCIERRGQVLEGFVLSFPVDEVPGRHRALICSRHRFPKCHQPIGLGIWQWPQHHGVYHTKDGGVRADTESERDNRHQSKARTL